MLRQDYIETGFADIDEILVGLDPKTLTVVAGHSSCGKSSFVKSIAVNAAVEHEVLYVCLEQSEEMLVKRLMAGASGIDSMLLDAGDLTSEQWKNLRKSKDELSKLKITICTRVFTLDSIKSAIESLVKPPKLLIVDFLQLLTTETENINEQITELVRGLREIASQYNLAVLAVSSTNCHKTNWESDHFQIYDVDPSEAIMNDSDVVMLLYRDELCNPSPANKGIVDVQIVKHRNGPRGSAKMIFEPEFSRFSTISKHLDI